MKLTISKGYRKYIRKEKARIRREVLDVEEQKRQIEKLYEGIEKQEKEKKPKAQKKTKLKEDNTK
jgi:hypothetical protein